MVAGLAALSEATLEQRFLAAVNRERVDLNWLRRLDGDRGFALGACSYEGDPVGLVRWQRDEGDTAEIAAVIVDGWQRRGVGTLLAGAVAAAARGQGIKHFRCSILADNRAARALLLKLGRVSVLRGGFGVVELTVELD